MFDLGRLQAGRELTWVDTFNCHSLFHKGAGDTVGRILFSYGDQADSFFQTQGADILAVTSWRLAIELPNDDNPQIA